MLCISARLLPACGVCLSVRLSRSWVAPKRIKISSNFFTIGSQAILVFPCQMGWRYSDGNPPNGGVECRWGRQKTRFWTNIAAYAAYRWGIVQCCKPYESRSVKNKAATDGVEPSTHGGVRRRCSHKTTTQCLWRARRYTPETEVNPPDTTPWS